MQIHISGPVCHSVTLKPHAGAKDPKPTDLDLPPGVYRVAIVITEKSTTPKKLFRELRLSPGMIVAVAFDAAHQMYKP